MIMIYLMKTTQAHRFYLCNEITVGGSHWSLVWDLKCFGNYTFDSFSLNRALYFVLKSNFYRSWVGRTFCMRL